MSKKISELTELTIPATDDELVIVDNSEVETKKITLSNLKASGTDIDTGTEDVKFVTPKAIADSGVSTAKATGSDIDTGTDNDKYVTAKAIKDSNVAFMSDIANITKHGVRESTIVGSYVKLFQFDMSSVYKNTSITFKVCSTQSGDNNALCNLFVYKGSSASELTVRNFKAIQFGGNFSTSKVVAVVTSTNVIDVYMQMEAGESPSVAIINELKLRDEDNYGKVTIDCSTVESSLPSGTQYPCISNIGDNYSTSEKVIGTWIDGKPLYRKVISFTTTESTYTYTQQNLGLSNPETTMVDYGHSYIKTASSGSYAWNANRPGSNTTLDGNASNNWGRINPDNNHFDYVVGSSVSSSLAIITIEYTKTTD